MRNVCWFVKTYQSVLHNESYVSFFNKVVVTCEWTALKRRNSFSILHKFLLIVLLLYTKRWDFVCPTNGGQNSLTNINFQGVYTIKQSLCSTSYSNRVATTRMVYRITFFIRHSTKLLFNEKKI